MKNKLIALAVIPLLLFVAATIVVTKISEYPNTTTVGTNDLFVIASGVTNKNVKYGDLRRIILEDGNPDTFNATNLYITEQIITSNFYTTNIFVENNEYVSNFYATNVFVTNAYITNLTVNNITNVNNEYVTNLYVTNLTVQTITNVSNEYVTNLYVTNLTVNNITNVTEVTSNLFVTNLYVTNLYATNIYNSNFFTTNLFTTNLYATNIYNSNIFTTNLTVQNITNVTLVTSNIFTTNLFVTNLYSSNFYTTNLFATNIYNSNFYTTNIFTTNLYATNIYNSNFFSTNITVQNITNVTLVTSNLYTTNLYVTNLTVNNTTNFNTFVTSNLFTTNLYATNIYTSNFYTTNLFATNIYTTNLFVTNITIGGSLAILYHDFTGSTNIDVGLSTWQGATLSANTAFRLTNSANGINPLLKFTEDASGGWVPTIAGIDQWDTPTNNWATNANAVNYVRILNAGGTVHALLDGTNALGGDTVWTNNAGTRQLLGTTNSFVNINFADENQPSFTFGTLLPGAIGPGFTADGTITGGTNVEAYMALFANGVINNTGFQVTSEDNMTNEHTTVSIDGATMLGNIYFEVSNLPSTNLGIRIAAPGGATRSLLDLSGNLSLGSQTNLASMSGGFLTMDTVPVLTRVEPIEAVTWGATTTIDVASSHPNYRTLTLGGTTTVAVSNKAAGHWFACIVTGAATNCNLTLPWTHYMNQAAPTSLAANKVASLTVFYVDGNDANAVVLYSVEP